MRTKTPLIDTLACRQATFFLTCLSRFGKSLFGKGLKDFAGLAIESLWKNQTYDVVWPRW